MVHTTRQRPLPSPTQNVLFKGFVSEDYRWMQEKAAEYDEAGESLEGQETVPLVILYELGWSEHHAKFREALAAVSCDKYVVISLLMRIAGATAFERTGKETLDEIRKDLARGVRGVRRLRRQEVLPLLRELARDDASVQRWLQDVDERLVELEELAHGNRALLLERRRATLVRYVQQTTGNWHDDHVCTFLEAATAPPLWPIDATGRSLPNPEWTFAALKVPTHVRWRERNRGLINEDSEWYQRFLEGAENGGAKNRPQRGGVTRPEGGGKPDRVGGPPSIPRVFCGTRRDVSSGALCGGAAQRVCGGIERARGGAPRRAGP